MNNAVLKIICASIFLVPMASLIVMNGTIIWYPELLMFVVLGFTLASLYIWQVNKPLSILSLYCLYSYIFVIHQHPRALLCTVLAYLGIGLICVISKIANTAVIYKTIIAMAVLQFVLVILQRFNLDPFFHLNGHEGISDTVGFLGSHNQLGIYYAAISPILFHFCFPLLAIAIVSVFFTHCSSAAIGLIGGVGAYLTLFKFKYLLMFVIPLAIVFCFTWNKFDLPGGAFKERVDIWKLTVNQALKGKMKMDMGDGMTHIMTANPLTGFGIGSFIMLSPPTQGVVLIDNNHAVVHKYEHAHNDLVEFFFEFGWLGLPILLFILLDILSKFVLSVKTNLLIVTFSSLLAQGVMSLGVYILHAPVSYFMLCLMLGLFYAEVNNARTFSKTA